MKREIKIYSRILFFALLLTTSCNKDKVDVVPKEGIKSSELIFTALSEDVTPHGDHFHGIAKATEKESVVVKFDNTGKVISNGHIHLESDVVYKMQLKVYDYENREIQNSYIATKDVANSYKAFLIADKIELNSETDVNNGAIFYPRDLVYGDGVATDTYNKYELTGILSYFILGERNAKSIQKISYVLRKFKDSGTKSKVELKDLFRADYSSAFPGEDILNLKFEIHAETH